MRKVLIVILAATTTGCATAPSRVPFEKSPVDARPAAPAVEQKYQPTPDVEATMKLFEVFVTCASGQARILAATSSEAADIAARAAVGLCGPQYADYSRSIRSWRTWATNSAGADDLAQSQRQKVIDMALTIIVRDRQRGVPAHSPANSPPKDQGI